MYFSYTHYIVIVVVTNSDDEVKCPTKKLTVYIYILYVIIEEMLYIQ